MKREIFARRNNYSNFLFIIIIGILILGFVGVVVGEDPVNPISVEDLAEKMSKYELTPTDNSALLSYLKLISTDLTKLSEPNLKTFFNYLNSANSNYDIFNEAIKKFNTEQIVKWFESTELNPSNSKIWPLGKIWKGGEKDGFTEDSKKKILKSLNEDKKLTNEKKIEYFNKLWGSLKTADEKIDSDAKEKLIALLNSDEMKKSSSSSVKGVKSVKDAFLSAITGVDIKTASTNKLEYKKDPDAGTTIGKEHIFATVNSVGATFDLLNLPNNQVKGEPGFKVTGVDISSTALKLISNLQGNDKIFHTFTLNLVGIKDNIDLSQTGSMKVNGMPFDPFYGAGGNRITGETVTAELKDGNLVFGGNGYVRVGDRIYGKNTGNNANEVLNLVLGPGGAVKASGDIFAMNPDKTYLVVRSDELQGVYGRAAEAGSGKGGIFIANQKDGTSVVIIRGVHQGENSRIEVVNGQQPANFGVASLDSNHVVIERSGRVSSLAFKQNELVEITFEGGKLGWGTPDQKPVETPAPSGSCPGGKCPGTQSQPEIQQPRVQGTPLGTEDRLPMQRGVEGSGAQLVPGPPAQKIGQQAIINDAFTSGKIESTANLIKSGGVSKQVMIQNPKLPDGWRWGAFSQSGPKPITPTLFNNPNTKYVLVQVN